MFVKEYLVDLNATQACIRAGYSPRTAKQQGTENLAKPVLKEAIQKAMNERAKKIDITAELVAQELAKIGFANIKSLYDSEGRLKNINELPEDVTACIQEIAYEETEDAETGQRTIKGRYKIADKKESLKLLGQHLKMFTEKIEHNLNGLANLFDDEFTDEQLLDELNARGLENFTK